MTERDEIDEMMEFAREANPFGKAPSFGFETRLREVIRESGDSVVDWVALFSWRFSFACLPVLFAVVGIIAFQAQGSLTAEMNGMSSLVTNWAGFLPIEI